MRKLLVLGSLSVLVTSGCGASEQSATTTLNRRLDEGAARFAVAVQARLRRGDFRRAWRSLHPAQKRYVSAAKLASCYPRTEFPERVTFRATEVRDVSWTVPGTSMPSEAKEVTVTAKSPGRSVDRFAQHVIRVGGRWRWILSGKFFRAAKNARC